MAVVGVAGRHRPPRASRAAWAAPLLALVAIALLPVLGRSLIWVATAATASPAATSSTAAPSRAVLPTTGPSPSATPTPVAAATAIAPTVAASPWPAAARPTRAPRAADVDGA